MPPAADYDACVLYPAPLRDLLMRLAWGRMAHAHWSDAIHNKWIRDLLADRPDVSRGHLERTRALMERVVPDASVRGYQPRILALALPNPDDRHVLAALPEAGATAIVTFNLVDFPRSAPEPHGARRCTRTPSSPASATPIRRVLSPRCGRSRRSRRTRW